jgi:alpha-galactosidase/6-phospho-beta-glucosidase family protein
MKEVTGVNHMVWAYCFLHQKWAVLHICLEKQVERSTFESKTLRRITGLAAHDIF